MKILKTTNVNPIQRTLKKSILPALMLSTFISCIANSNNKDSFEYSKNSAKTNIEANTSTKIETQKSDKTNSIDLEKVKMTKGLIKNRNPQEIQKMTGLRPKEFEVLNKEANKLINDHYAENLGKLHYVGTKYDAAFNHEVFYIVYTNGNENLSFTWKPKGQRFQHLYSLCNMAALVLKVKREENGDFSLMRRVGADSDMSSYTKDGALIESQKSKQISNIDLKKVKMTDGLIKNRNPLEIQKMTGLRPKEFEVLNKEANKLINNHYAKKLGKLHFAGTKYVDKIGEDYLSIVYTNGDKDEVFTWNNRQKRFEHFYGWFDDAGLILRVQREKNGDFSLKRIVDFKSDRLNYTKDGALKNR